MTDILNRLAELLEQRKSADPASSYVAKLYAKGMDAILKKVGEEAIETILAAKGDKREEIIYETADLWFHTLVMLVNKNIKPQEVLDELARREGLSGIEEKNSRLGLEHARLTSTMPSIIPNDAGQSSLDKNAKNRI